MILALVFMMVGLIMLVVGIVLERNWVAVLGIIVVTVGLSVKAVDAQNTHNAVDRDHCEMEDR